MAHILYNHITHCWDEPDADLWSETDGRFEEPMAFGPTAQLAIRRLALAAATLMGGFVAWGLIAGILLGIS